MLVSGFLGRIVVLKRYLYSAFLKTKVTLHQHDKNSFKVKFSRLLGSKNSGAKFPMPKQQCVVYLSL